MNKIREWLSHNWWWFVPVVLSVAVMLPRLASPQFGIEDDAKSILSAQRILNGSWSPADEASTGRFRPMYWLSFAAVYALAGSRPDAFFLANLLVLALTSVGLSVLVRQFGGSRLQASLAGIFFVLSGPVIESFYTTSKSEPTQALWLVGAVLSARAIVRASSRPKQVLWGVLAALLLELAFMTKETTVVMVVIAAAWLGLDVWLRRSRFDRFSLALLLCSLAAIVVFLGLREYFLPHAASAGGYTSHYAALVSLISAQIYRWGGWLIRDYPFLLLALVFLPALWRRNHLRDTRPLILASVIWMLGWMAVFLPWIYMAEYYMLPFALGASVFAGVIFGAAIEWVRADTTVLRVAALALAFILFLFTLSDNISNARLQLTIDYQNQQMLNLISRALQPGEPLYVNLPPEDAYIKHIGLHLALRGLAENQVAAFDLKEPPSGPYVLIAPEIKNQPLFFVRLGTYEEGSNKWNAAMKKVIGAGKEPIFSTEGSYRQSNINLVKAICPLVHLEFCQTGAPLVDSRMLYYGWKAYEVRNP